MTVTRDKGCDIGRDFGSDSRVSNTNTNTKYLTHLNLIPQFFKKMKNLCKQSFRTLHARSATIAC